VAAAFLKFAKMVSFSGKKSEAAISRQMAKPLHYFLNTPTGLYPCD
jgi:hypothetical protein